MIYRVVDDSVYIMYNYTMYIHSRINLTFKDKKGQIALDQIRVLGRSRIIKVLGSISESTQNNILNTLAIMFSR